jgi:hypothetical protein
MSNKSIIRNLVNRALLAKRFTPEMETLINQELSVQGYITDPDYEALEISCKRSIKAECVKLSKYNLVNFDLDVIGKAVD